MNYYISDMHLGNKNVIKFDGRGFFHVYGHIHNDKEEVFGFVKRQERALNAGCMINDFEPVTLAELILNNKKFQENTK